MICQVWVADQGKVGRCVIRLVYVHPTVQKDLIAASFDTSATVCRQNQFTMTRFTVDIGQRYGHK